MSTQQRPQSVRNSYKQKYQKLRTKLTEQGKFHPNDDIGSGAIKDQLSRTNRLLSELEAATLSAISIQKQIAQDTNLYAEVGDLTFDVIDPFSHTETLPDMVRGLSGMICALMDRFAIVSEAYKEIVYLPRQDPEALADIVYQSTRQRKLSQILIPKNAAGTGIGIDPSNPGGIGVRGKKVRFELLSPIDGIPEYNMVVTNEPNKGFIGHTLLDEQEEREANVRDTIREVVTGDRKGKSISVKEEIESIIETIPDPRLNAPKPAKRYRRTERDELSTIPESSVRSKSTDTTRSDKSKRSERSIKSETSDKSTKSQAKLKARRPDEPEYQNRASQVVKRLLAPSDLKKRTREEAESSKKKK